MSISVPKAHSNTSPYIGKLYPSGDGGLGYNPPHKKRDCDRVYDSDYDRQFDKYEVKTVQNGREKRRLEEYFLGEHEASYQRDPKNFKKAKKRLEQLFVQQGKDPSNIGLSAPRNLRKIPERPKRYGKRGITNNGKRVVRSGVTVKEDIYGINRLAFLTVTLPSPGFGVTMAQLEYISRNYAQYLRRYLEELERALVRKGGIPYITGVVEMHPKRSIKCGFPVLHFHAVFVSHNGDHKHYVTANELRQINRRVIANMLKVEPESVNTSASVDVQAIKKSASSYLGKYLSKGSKDVEKFIEKGKGDCLPRQWWFCRGGMRKVVRELTIELTGEVAKMLIDSHEIFLKNGWLAYWKPVEVNYYVGGGKHSPTARYRRMIVGYSFAFTKEGMQACLSWMLDGLGCRVA